MPIKNLSEEVRLPRLGKFHLGYKDPVKGNPVKTDYFVIPKDHSDYATIVKIFGEKPKELRIYIPVEDEEQWCSQYYKAYDRTHGLVCKGDGETAMRMIDIKTGLLPNKDSRTVAMKEMVCAGKECPEYKAKKCGEAMNLRFVLPEVPGLGVWQIDTGSINSILNINSCGRLIKKAFGRISMVPLKLTLEPIEVNNPETHKKQTVYVLNLRTAVTMNQLADAAREQSKQLMIGAPELEAEYEAQIERDTDDLFGPADKLPEPKPTPETSTPSPVIAESKVIPQPVENKPSQDEPTAKDILFMTVREHKPALKTDKNILDWLTGPLGIPTGDIENTPDKVLVEIKKSQKWS